MPEAFLTAMRTFVTKVVGAKATCFCRTAFEVDRAIHDERDTVLGGHGLMLDLEFGQGQLGLYCLGDLGADVDVVTNRFLARVEVGQGEGRFADAQRNGASLLDLLEGAIELLGQSAIRGQPQDQRKQDAMLVHVKPPMKFTRGEASPSSGLFTRKPYQQKQSA